MNAEHPEAQIRITDHLTHLSLNVCHVDKIELWPEEGPNLCRQIISLTLSLTLCVRMRAGKKETHRSQTLFSPHLSPSPLNLSHTLFHPSLLSYRSISCVSLSLCSGLSQWVSISAEDHLSITETETSLLSIIRTPDWSFMRKMLKQNLIPLPLLPPWQGIETRFITHEKPACLTL